MRADQLRSAVDSIAELLKRSDTLTSIRQCRDARELNHRKAASNRLGQSAKIIIQGVQSFSAAEQLILKQVHLDRLSSIDYWKALITLDGDDKARQAELVQLYSRIMFASSHLPKLSNLLVDVASTPAVVKARPGEGTMSIQLLDAGEKASDPDRIARAIDGLDMVYSASASLARKPAMDLQLRDIVGHPEKTLTFLGDHDCINAVFTILESIPEAMAAIDPEEDIDIQALVDSLPVFEDLATLDSLGTFSREDIRDINDTMHQGVLLSLESGVVLDQGPTAADPTAGVQTLNKRVGQMESSPDAIVLGSDTSGHVAPPIRENVAPAQRSAAAQTAEGTQTQNSQQSDPQPDEYYQQYLAEREKLRDQGGIDDFDVDDGNKGDRGSAMASLLKGLGRSKN